MWFSVIKLCWDTFMDYFGWVMELADESQLAMVLISCSMAVAFILNVRSGWAVLHELERTVGNRRIKARLSRYPSPVHIATSGAFRRHLQLPLVWTHYDEPPLAMLLENNGSTVVLRICCPLNSVPHLSGGELGGRYHFVEAIFKWGVLRSEHSIDGRQSSLEMQVLHRCPQQKGACEYLALSYLFILNPCKNGLHQITDNLKWIQRPGSSIELPPFDLGTLLRTFARGYYTYQGSYDNGELELPVTWLIDPQIFSVRAHQAVEFAALFGKDGKKIIDNARREQSLGSRSVLFHS